LGGQGRRKLIGGCLKKRVGKPRMRKNTQYSTPHGQKAKAGGGGAKEFEGIKGKTNPNKKGNLVPGQGYNPPKTTCTGGDQG